MRQDWIAFVLLGLGLSVGAQESIVPKASIPLIALDSHHRPTSVAVESLVIADQKKLVAGASLQRGADLPLELGVLIDVSTSERDTYIRDIAEAIHQFLVASLRGPDDRVFLLKFEFTAQATRWLKKEDLGQVTVEAKVGGATALYDALGIACTQRFGPRDWQKPTRRVLVLISDGDDNQSHMSRDEAVAQALKSGAVIFGINTATYGMPSRGGRIMEYFATMTGGESFSNLSKGDIPKVFSALTQLIGAMYYLTYVPPEGPRAAFHELEVKPAPKQKMELSYARKYFWNP